MENLEAIFIELLLAGAVITYLGLRYLHSPSITNANKVEILQGLQFHHEGGD